MRQLPWLRCVLWCHLISDSETQCRVLIGVRANLLASKTQLKDDVEESWTPSADACTAAGHPFQICLSSCENWCELSSLSWSLLLLLPLRFHLHLLSSKWCLSIAHPSTPGCKRMLSAWVHINEHSVFGEVNDSFWNVSSLCSCTPRWHEITLTGSRDTTHESQQEFCSHSLEICRSIQLVS